MKKLPSLLLFSPAAGGGFRPCQPLPRHLLPQTPCPKCGEGVLQQLRWFYTPWS